jgi:hypothetical protein
MKKLLVIASAILTLSSCTHHLTSGNAIEPTVTFNAKANLELDVQIDTTKLLTGYSKTTTILGFIRFGDRNFIDTYTKAVGDREKKAATYKALDGTNHDVIINPKYQISTYRGLLIQSTKCRVSGYGGKYVFKTSTGTIPDVPKGGSPDMDESPATTSKIILINKTSNPEYVGKFASFNFGDKKLEGKIINADGEFYVLSTTIDGVEKILQIPTTDLIKVW